ncbi:MAG: DUF2093 domain-containing protein [Pseudomonadota bacterium]|nr:DUF2093 domain-containing protein [Pseudomonadota bacterium]
MNAHDRRLGSPAVLRYDTPDFEVIEPGSYVLCAVSGRRIALQALRYWSPELQEAYAGPEEVLARMRELGRAG